MIPRNFTRSQTLLLVVFTAFFVRFFEYDIDAFLLWSDQTIIQPHLQLLNDLFMFGIIGFVGCFACWGLWLAFEKQIRKYGYSIFVGFLCIFHLLAGFYCVLANLNPISKMISTVWFWVWAYIMFLLLTGDILDMKKVPPCQ